MTTKFNDNAIKLAPWSATKLKTATKCPFRAYYSWVEKSKEIHNVPLDDSPMIIGIQIHTLMELILDKFPDDIFPHMKDVQALGDRMLQVILKEDLTIREQDVIDSLYFGTVSTCQRFLAHKFNSKSLTFVEIPVAIDTLLQPVDFNSRDAFFRGKIDFTMITPSGSVAIIDAKTGQWPSLKAHAQQLRVYEILTAYSLKKRFKDEYNIDLTSIISGLAYVASEEVLWDKSRTIALVEGAGTQNFINEINTISNKVFVKEIKRGNHCDFCGYKHLCGSRRGMKKKKAEQILM